MRSRARRVPRGLGCAVRPVATAPSLPGCCTAHAGGASVRCPSFSGGGGRPGSITAVTLEGADKRELARWGNGEGELPEALAAPIWGRYALFRGHPRITGLVMWDAAERQVVVAGERGGRRFDEVLFVPRPLTRLTATAPPTTPRDTSPRPAVLADQRSSLPARGAGEALRVCEHCGDRSPLGFAPRRATAQSAAGRPPRAPGSGSSLPSLPLRRLRGAAGAAGRCPPVCERRPGFAQSAVGRRSRATPSTPAVPFLTRPVWATRRVP